MVIENALVVLTVVTCAVCLYTDLRYKKIKNAVIIPTTFVGLAINIIASIINGFFSEFAVNFAVVTAFSMGLYFFRFWGAGDSKFLIFVISTMPVYFYHGMLRGYFSSFVILMYIFFVAFIYLIVESIVLLIRKTETLKRDKAISKQILKPMIIGYIGGMSVITGLNMLFYFTLGSFYIENQYFLMLINFFVVISISKTQLYRHLSVVLIITSVIIAVMFVSGYIKQFAKTDYKFPLIFLGLILLREFMSRYDYKKIEVQQLKEGMILSTDIMTKLVEMGFKPRFAPDETVKSKLSIDDIAYIQKLCSDSTADMYIVRNLRFGSMIAVGTILFVIGRIICK